MAGPGASRWASGTTSCHVPSLKAGGSFLSNSVSTCTATSGPGPHISSCTECKAQGTTGVTVARKMASAVLITHLTGFFFQRSETSLSTCRPTLARLPSAPLHRACSLDRSMPWRLRNFDGVERTESLSSDGPVGDVARYVDGSLCAGRVNHAGNWENSRGPFVAHSVSSRRSSSSASATSIDAAHPAPEPHGEEPSLIAARSRWS
jgi:hypothetical protein